MKKIYTLLFTAVLAFSANAQDFTATYDFAGATTSSGLTDPSPVPTASGLVFGSFNVVNPNLAASVNGSSGVGRFSFPNQPVGGTNGDNVYANLTGAIDTGIYYQVTLTPNTGQSLDLSQIKLRAQRSGTGVRTFAVRSSLDGYTSNLSASYAPDPADTSISVETGNVFFFTADVTSGFNGSSISLGSAFDNITSAITFRFYAWNAEAATGNFSIDDVVFTGSTTTLGVNQNQIQGLKVYPNPVTNGTFYINTNADSTKEVVVYDVLGKQVVKTTTTNAVNVSNLKGGVYIVKITEEGKTATRKLVIK